MRKVLFKHNFLPVHTIKRVDTIEGRYYETPTNNRYKSVTTILSENTDKSYLKKWRNRVGYEEADRITKEAGIRGTAVHSICESYLLNKDKIPDDVSKNHIETFKHLRPYLDKNIKEIFGIELPLYSDTLKTAGTADLVANYNNKLSVVDFKTSLKPKKEEWIENYFLQATVYGLMTNELFSLDIEQIVVIIAVDNSDPQVFIKPLEEYKEKVLEIFK